VKTYTVTGATPAAIVRSVRARGPYSPWIGGRAEAVTQPTRTYQFAFSSSLVEVTPGTWTGVCQIRQDAIPAISQTYTILLPKWTPPRGASSATIRWWADEILRVATHERTHVQNGITATKAANLVLASSTCANAESRLNAVWLDEQRHDCEFDMREYGKAAGLSLKSCTSQ
jgi:predicted secreted Zn-dependent protease